MRFAAIYVFVSIAILIAIAVIVNRLSASAEGLQEPFEDLSQQLTQIFNPLATTVVISSDATTINNSLRAATDLVGVESRASTTTMTTPHDPSFLQFPIEPADVAAAKVCEAIKQTDIDSCGLLATAAQQQCGFCLKDGTTHDGQPQRGGLYISQADRRSIEALASARGEKPVYKPSTVGSATCAPGYFFIGPDQCKDGVRQLSCAVGGSVRADGTCGQCVDYPDNFVYVGPQPAQFDAILRIIGDGTLTVSVNSKIIIQSQQLAWGQEMTVTLPQLVEGDVLTVAVSGSSHKALIGQLESVSSATARTVPLDIIIGKSVRRLGTLATASLPGVSPTTISPNSFWMWAGPDGTTASSSFAASGPIPATVRGPQYPVDAARCPTGALIMTPAGQKIWDTDPCRGPADGKPTATCARFLWTSGGCLPAGAGYSQAESLGSNVGDVAAAVADLVSVQQTGKHTNGTAATRAQIVTATKQCSGVTLSACDGPLKQTGPQDPECLREIYNNPTTYSADYPPCGPGGSMNPSNPIAISQYTAFGGVDNIRAELRGIQQNAVAGATPAIQTAAMAQCYGLSIVGNTPATCPAITAIIKAGRRMSIGLVSGPTTRYVRHANYVFWADPDDNSDLMHHDGTFTVRPALFTGAAPGAISFESVNYPGYFITSSGGQSRLSPNQPGNTAAAAAASYIVQIGTGSTFTLSTGGQYLALLGDGRSVGLASAPTQWTAKTALF